MDKNRRKELAQEQKEKDKKEKDEQRKKEYEDFLKKRDDRLLQAEVKA